MLSQAHILLPVDFSQRSPGAAHHARTLAEHFHSRLTLLHALPPFHYTAIPMEAGAASFVPVAEAEKELECFATRELPDFPAHRVVLRGDPARTIVDYAHSENASLIVMPTHGYGPFRRFLLGSVTAKVLHDVDCPVWTGVHLEEAPPVESLRSGNIMCALDLGPESEKTLEWAEKMAGEFGARLILVHALPRLETQAGDYFDPNWQLVLERQARERIEQLCVGRDGRPEIFIESGDVPKLVRCAALRYRAGLLVIGRGSAAGAFGRLRTNAYAILRESPCPVVSV